MDDRSEVVIGQEMAAAIEAERRRLETSGPTPSPLPPGGDDPWSGQRGLFRIEPVPYDEALTAFAYAYRARDAAGRVALRDEVGFDDGYTLLTFARRCAVFSMRDADPAQLEVGLAALAAIAYERVDQRDGLWALALLHHAAHRVHPEPAVLLSRTAGLGEPTFARLVDDFLARPAADRNLRDAWGFVEVDGPHGLGLLSWGFAPWHPTFDLVRTGLDLADALRGDRYAIDDPMLAVRLPSIWLSGADDPGLEPTLEEARAALAIHAHLHPDVTETHADQQLTTWLVELTDEGAAGRLATLSLTPRSGHALLGLASGSLFALIVARSVRLGVEAFESGHSLRRFEVAVRGVLER